MTPNNIAAGSKRKSEEPVSSPQAKSMKITPSSGPGRSAAQLPQTAAPSRSLPNVATAPYRGTARSAAPNSAIKPVSKPVSKSSLGTAVPPIAPLTQAGATTSTAVPSKKRGFAALLEKAKVSQEASKVAVNNGIKHKPMDRVSRKEREKLQKVPAVQQQKARPATQPKAAIRAQSGAVQEARPSLQKKATETSYKGTMRKAPVELGYKGTMKAAGHEKPASKPVAKKGLGQDKYGGYASWSDLDEAEDDEEDYDSGGSSDMEGGFDDVEREEIAALRAARREDQEALQEEERHRQDKLDRKKRLEALNKNAAARRRI